jgi:predicted small metal-binding protein
VEDLLSAGDTLMVGVVKHLRNEHCAKRDGAMSSSGINKIKLSINDKR